MECPYCGEPMECGTISRDRYMTHWVAGERGKGRLFRRRIPLLRMSMLDTEGFFCPKCKKVIIDVSEQLEEHDDYFK